MPLPAPVTRLLLVVIGAVFVAEVFLGGSQSPEVLVRLGANYGPAIEAGEWWRLVASMFLHIGVLHLLFNGWALYQLGRLMELLVGSSRFAAVYFASGIGGSVASYVWTHLLREVEHSLSAGASGAIFGVLGALISFLGRRHERLTPAARSLLLQLLLWAGLNVVLGLTTPSIDNAGHMGGLAVGLVMGLTLEPRVPRRPAGAPPAAGPER